MNKLQNRVIEICYENNNGHIASSLSCLGIIEFIYKNFDFNDDVFLLSKGHACPALFAVLETHGYNPDVSQHHPDIDIKNGVSCTSGSLGHCLPIAIGMALAKKLKGEKGTIHVLLGDGECMEGTTWESILLQNHLNLDNLKIHIDYNEMQSLKSVDSDMLKALCQINNKIIVYKTIKNFPHVYHLTTDIYKELIK